MSNSAKEPNNQHAQLENLLPSLKGKRAVVVGDIAADHYILGSTSRISREAPVLILRYLEEKVIPGQVGNTAANIASLGGRVDTICLIGTDARGRELKNALRRAGVGTSRLLQEKGLSTLTKTRIMAGGHHARQQQVIRIDDDERMSVSSTATQRVCDAMQTAAKDADVLVISDYGYGLISDQVWDLAVELKVQYQIPLVLDSRYDLTRRPGATIITPNEGEALACVGLTVQDAYDIDEVGKRLLKLSRAENVLITRGNEGMVLFRPKAAPVVIPIFGSEESTDVTGAGDTVVATLALALAAGADALAAASLANVAGGLVVMKVGTATVTVPELQNAVSTKGL